MLGVWMAGGALAFAGAMAYAELAALRPRAGGEYVYLREAFGPVAAFLTGWTSFVAGFSGAIAASAVGFATYLGRFVPAAANTTPLASLSAGLVHLQVSLQSLFAIGAIAALSVVHIRGVGPGRVVQNVAGGREGHRAPAVHRVGIHGRRRRLRSSHRCWPRRRRRMAARAGAGDVQLLRMERRDVRGGGGPRSRSRFVPRALGARHRRGRRSSTCCSTALRLLDARVGAAAAAGQRRGRRLRTACSVPRLAVCSRS